MVIVAILWTIFTLAAVFASLLLILQLFTIWASTGLLLKLFGETKEKLDPLESQNTSAKGFMPRLNEFVDEIVEASSELERRTAALRDEARAKRLSVQRLSSVKVERDQTSFQAPSLTSEETIIVQPVPGVPAQPVQTAPTTSQDTTDLLNASEESSKLEAIKKAAIKVGIPHLIHFTNCDNLASIMQHGIQSVASCEANDIKPSRNDCHRFDGQLDGISLSITFPNQRMFWKYRQLGRDLDWVVIILKPRILWEKDCAFYPLNAADARMIANARDEMKSADALEAMFSVTQGSRDEWLKPYDPTDIQAEVMVYETIETSEIQSFAFETSEVRDRYKHLIPGYSKFYAGEGKGLFSTRKDVRLGT